MEFGKRLKELRLEKGVYQKEVAEAIGVTKGAYGNYENGHREPEYAILVKLCKYFKVSADYLLGLED